MVFQSSYRIRNNWSVNGHYTVQLKNDGNYEGEGDQHSLATRPPSAITRKHSSPTAITRTDSSRTSSAIACGSGASTTSVWARSAMLSFSGLWRIEGERAYSLGSQEPGTRRPLRGRFSRRPAIRISPGTAAHLFRRRARHGALPGLRLARYLDINYNIPVFRSLRPVAEVRRLQSVRQPEADRLQHHASAQNAAGPKDTVGLATTFTKGSSFGKATGNTATNLNYAPAFNTFPLAFHGAPAGGRTFRVAVGFRF